MAKLHLLSSSVVPSSFLGLLLPLDVTVKFSTLTCRTLSTLLHSLTEYHRKIRKFVSMPQSDKGCKARNQDKERSGHTEGNVTLCMISTFSFLYLFNIYCFLGSNDCYIVVFFFMGTHPHCSRAGVVLSLTYRSYLVFS